MNDEDDVHVLEERVRSCVESTLRQHGSMPKTYSSFFILKQIALSKSLYTCRVSNSLTIVLHLTEYVKNDGRV